MATANTGPEADTERPLAEHLVELRNRMLIAIAAVLVGAVAAAPFSQRGLQLVVARVASEGVGLAVYTPLEYVVVQIYFVLAAGLVLGVPVVVYEAYAFMAPGLYRWEKRFFLLAVPASLVLLLLGGTLAWHVVVPTLAPVLMSSGEVARAAISLEAVFFFVVGLMVVLGLVFQLPLIVALAVWSGATTPDTLLNSRLYAYGGFFFLASAVTLDPTMASQLILTAVFIALYEVSVRAVARLARGRGESGPR